MIYFMQFYYLYDANLHMNITERHQQRSAIYSCLLNQCKYYIGNNDDAPLRLKHTY
jgi:hypothetical protein